MRSKTPNQAGFTIVELIITILLIGLLLPTIVTFLNAITNMNGRASTISTINAYVENRIETFRSAGFKSVPITAGDVSFTGAETLPSTLPQPHTATYNVALVDASNPSLKKITITVSFRSFDSTETRTYITYLGELGVGQY
ncbi:MAG: prepilin-type N-terminal cleavage/methylation domain-containing protein [Candidatus Saccharimonadales bacterium]